MWTAREFEALCEQIRRVKQELLDLAAVADAGHWGDGLDGGAQALRECADAVGKIAGDWALCDAVEEPILGADLLKRSWGGNPVSRD